MKTAFFLAALFVAVPIVKAADVADPKQAELSEVLDRHGFTDEVLTGQPKTVALGVAECSAKHLLCEGDRCLAQLDMCVSLAAAHMVKKETRGLSSLERTRRPAKSR